MGPTRGHEPCLHHRLSDIFSPTGRAWFTGRRNPPLNAVFGTGLGRSWKRALRSPPFLANSNDGPTDAPSEQTATATATPKAVIPMVQRTRNVMRRLLRASLSWLAPTVIRKGMIRNYRKSR